MKPIETNRSYCRPAAVESFAGQIDAHAQQLLQGINTLADRWSQVPDSRPEDAQQAAGVLEDLRLELNDSLVQLVMLDFESGALIRRLRSGWVRLTQVEWRFWK